MAKIEIPAAAAAALMEYGGKVFRLDPADVAAVEFLDHVESIEVPDGSGGVRHEAGAQRVTITVHMGPGARATWIDKE